MAFTKGQSGNPSGMKREKKFLAALERAIAQDDSQRLRDAAEKVLDLAAQGESWAVQFIADRLDGKAMQQVEHSGEVGTRYIAELPDVPTTAEEWAQRYQPTRQ